MKEKLLILSLLLTVCLPIAAQQASNKFVFTPQWTAHVELMADTANLTSDEIINKLKSAVATHRSGAEPNDDFTLLCLKIKTV